MNSQQQDDRDSDTAGQEAEISRLEEILASWPAAGDPDQWASNQRSLAVAYTYRILGDRVDNIERAIKAYEAALTVLTRDAGPRVWATIQNDLAIAYKHRVRDDRA